VRRPLWIVALALAAVTLSGCSSGDGDDTDASPTQPASTSTAPGGSPTEGTPGTTLDPLVAAFAADIQRSDAGFDVKAVRKCLKKTPTDKKCAAEVDGLALSTQAVILQWGNLPDAPAEVADLVTQTHDAVTTLNEAANAYLDACPDAGATSDECVTKLDELANTTGQPLLDAYKLWRPYIKILEG
jgi:hypothetical protein